VDKPLKSVTHGQCDARPTEYGYLPSRRASPPLTGAKLYCLVTEARVCEPHAQGCYLKAKCIPVSDHNPTLRLKERLTDHRSTISIIKQTAISMHFRSTLHALEHLEIIPIEQIEKNDEEYRLERETLLD